METIFVSKISYQNFLSGMGTLFENLHGSYAAAVQRELQDEYLSEHPEITRWRNGGPFPTFSR